MTVASVLTAAEPGMDADQPFVPSINVPFVYDSNASHQGTAFVMPACAVELAPAILAARRTAAAAGRHLAFVCSVTCTEKDPQVRSKVEASLRAAGAIVLPTNAAAARFAGRIVKELAEKAGLRR